MLFESQTQKSTRPYLTVLFKDRNYSWLMKQFAKVDIDTRE